MNTTTTHAPATDKQLAFIAKLAAERNVPINFAGTKAQASKTIEALLAMPKPVTTKAAPVAPKPAAVEDGRYALVAPGPEGGFDYFHVNTPTEGKWAGFTFVGEQAGPNVYPVKGARKADVLARIAVDPKAATILYGKTLGICGVCGIELTNKVSQDFGVGPVCRANKGW